MAPARHNSDAAAFVVGVLINPTHGVSTSILEERNPAEYAMRQAQERLGRRVLATAWIASPNIRLMSASGVSSGCSRRRRAISKSGTASTSKTTSAVMDQSNVKCRPAGTALATSSASKGLNVELLRQFSSVRVLALDRGQTHFRLERRKMRPAASLCHRMLLIRGENPRRHQIPRSRRAGSGAPESRRRCYMSGESCYSIEEFSRASASVRRL